MSTLEKVLIIDFGGQSAQLLARLIREQQVYCEIMPYDLSFKRLTAARPSALILAGEAAGAPLKTFYCDPRFYQLPIPILAIGDGMTALVKDLGGKLWSLPPLQQANYIFPSRKRRSCLQAWSRFASPGEQ